MGKKVIVTGCNQGLGYSICQRFECEGYKVYGIDLIEGEYNQYMGSCDLCDPVKTEEDLKKLFLEKGTPDVLVNNAGVYFGVNWESQTLEQYDKTLDVNSRAVFYVTKLFAQQLIKKSRPGSVVNVSSISAQIGSVDFAYAASKASVEALTKSFAKALALHSIRVNGIAPGPLNTELGKRIPDDRKKEYVKTIIQKRFGEPSEAANVIYFLASEEASLMTGEIVNVTGGIL